jgi:hypothetical protein
LSAGSRRVSKPEICFFSTPSFTRALKLCSCYVLFIGVYIPFFAEE